MKLPEDLARAFARLFDHYDRQDEDRGRHVRSLQAPFEAQMDAKAKAARHRAVVVRYNWLGRSLRVRGTDLSCGCTAHCYHPTQEGGRDYDGPDVRLDVRPDPMVTALRTLDSIQTVRLERLARVMLPPHLFVFGATFKSEGGARLAAPLRGVAQEPSRGPGTIADLSDTAVRLWGIHAREEVDQLGRRIYARAATAGERDTARSIRAEAEDAAYAALRQLDGRLQSSPRLPRVVTRAGVAA